MAPGGGRRLQNPAGPAPRRMEEFASAALFCHRLGIGATMVSTPPTLSDYDLHLLAEGAHYRSYERLGAHPALSNDQRRGVRFAVWAPNAARVSVMGDFNGWDPQKQPLRLRPEAGVWEGFVEGIGPGDLYKYHIVSRENSHTADKADPFAFAGELRPRTASKIWDLSRYEWGDGKWMQDRARRHSRDAPISIYELHLGSWRRNEQNGRWLSYGEIARLLADYVEDMGFTHVELLPVSEHPFDGSWGYQSAGYFAPTSRFGAPDDFMAMIDLLHQRGIGVIIDWAPAHFPHDAHGLGYFDGTHLYEHADPRKGKHPHWDTLIFNHGRREVANFLISNALFWFDRYHVDGLRVDAVASMLYLDYGREQGEWIPNAQGGRENLEAVDFLRRFNEQVYAEYPDGMTIAEESTSWPMVSRPTNVGGLGFGWKWNMGWMNDVLDYMSQDPLHRKYRHDKITFSMVYAFSENFLLPLSHDEVVHGKGSLWSKMPGDEWQRFASLRLLYGFLFGHPGKKLLFMGGEFGQREEWDHDRALSWEALDDRLHASVLLWVKDLNNLYRREPALHELDMEAEGFEWIDCSDRDHSVISFLRRGKRAEDRLLFVCNFTPIPRYDYSLGAPDPGLWREILNSDSALYGGTNQGNEGGVEAVKTPFHNWPCSLSVTLPPLAALVFRQETGIFNGLRM